MLMRWVSFLIIINTRTWLDRRYITKIAVYYTLFLIILSLIPVPDLGLPKLQLFEIDKLVHFIMYFSLTILWSFASKNLYNSNFKLLLFAIFFGFVLEIFQHMLPFGRILSETMLIHNPLMSFRGLRSVTIYSGSSHFLIVMKLVWFIQTQLTLV